MNPNECVAELASCVRKACNHYDEELGCTWPTELQRRVGKLRTIRLEREIQEDGIARDMMRGIR